MNQSGDTVGDVVFGGRRFIFWCLAPFLLLSGIGLPFLLDEWTSTMIIVTTVWSACCLLAIPAIYDAQRFWWAARCVTAIIFLGYVIYVSDEFLNEFGDTEFSDRRSESNLVYSIMGLFIIGLPCLWYTVLGRFRLTPPIEYEEDEFQESD